MQYFDEVFGELIGNGVEFFENNGNEVAKIFGGDAGSFWIYRDEASSMSCVTGDAFKSGACKNESLSVLCHFARNTDLHALGEYLSDKFFIEPDETNGTGFISECGAGEEHTLLETSLNGKLSKCPSECSLHSRRSLIKRQCL